MRPVEVEDAEVIEAGNQLLQANVRVSGYALRKKLNKGTPDRMLAVWDAHVALKLDPGADIDPTDLPNEAAESIQLMLRQQAATMRSVAVLLQKGANRKADQLVGERDATIAALNEQHAAELANAEQVIEAMKTTSAQQLSELQSLAVHLAAEQSKRESMTEELAQLRAQVIADAQVIARLKDESARQAPLVSELEALVAQHQAQTQAAVDELATVRLAHQQLQLASDAVGDMNNQRKAQLDLAHEKIHGLQIRVSDLSTQLEAKRTEAQRNWQTAQTLEQANGILLARLNPQAEGTVVPITKEAKRNG